MSRFVLRPIAAFGVLGIVALVVGAQAPAPVPSPQDEKTAKEVVSLLENNHMALPTINDETGKKWCKLFLKELDPQKLYFLQSDIDEFLPQATTLDDKIHEGKVDFSKQVFDRYLKRSDERLAMVVEALKQKPDFTLDESMADDPENLEYAKTDAEARERVRKIIKFELLRAKYDKEDEEETVKKLAIKYRDRNRFFHQFTSGDLLEFYLSSLSHTFDPHTDFMSKESWEDLIQQRLQLSLTGIGATLESADGFAVVKGLIPGGPADKDGQIQPEDKILGIQLEDGKEIDFVEKRLRDVVRYIRGDAGTHVRLIVQPANTKERKIYDIVRQKVDLSDERAKGQVVETKVDGKTLKIGVINLPSFYCDTDAVRNHDADAVSCTNDCRKLINEFKAKGVDAVMLDLRGNGGGLLTEAISLSGLFIDKGPVVQVKDVNGVKALMDEDEGAAWEGPFVLLIDRLSASASEIFAGVIKDYGRGLIIGDSSTFGKGTVQTIQPISTSGSRLLGMGRGSIIGALKLTIQQFYRVNGDSTQIRGVEPDIHIPSLFDQAEFGEGKMDNALKFDHVPEEKHDLYNRIPADLVAQLSAQSEKRRGASEKFQKRDAAIKKLVERKARHSISLNEEKFRAEVGSDDEEKNEAKEKAKLPKKRLSDHPAWEPNYYNDEVLSIVGDYLTLGSKVLAASLKKVAVEKN